MRILKGSIVAIVAVAALAVAIGAALPSGFSVRRSVEVKAPADRIYGYIVDPRQWSKWSVWTRRDPRMRIAYEGPAAGAGARWSWQSASEGNGAMQFTRAEENRVVEYALSFPDFGMRSTGALRLEPAGGGTRVTWTNTGDMGRNPLMHWLALAMDRMVGPDFEQGLANLKALAERS
jgi:uncharacterized protein YndB with AHSA1/START domain